MQGTHVMFDGISNTNPGHLSLHTSRLHPTPGRYQEHDKEPGVDRREPKNTVRGEGYDCLFCNCSSDRFALTGNPLAALTWPGRGGATFKGRSSNDNRVHAATRKPFPVISPQRRLTEDGRRREREYRSVVSFVFWQGHLRVC